MKLWSESWVNGERIPARYAAGKLDDVGDPTFSDNLNPHLAWSDAPAGTQTFALICHDFDVPSRGDDVNRRDREVPADLPRVDFFHWVLLDIAPSLSRIAEGEFSRGITPHGKSGPQVDHPGWQGARQGLNDFTGFFAGNPAMAGDYFGYDGPYPPFNDSLVHHYVFTLYALAIARASLTGTFTGAQARQAFHPHVLAEAAHSGTYTLNQRLIQAG